MHIIQPGGLAKVAAFMDLGDFVAGLKRSTQRDLFRRFKFAPEIGFYYERMQSNAAARYSPVGSEGTDSVFSNAEFRTAAGAMTQQMIYVAKAALLLGKTGAGRKNFGGAFRDLWGKSWTRFVSTIKTLNTMDAIMARVAFGGYLTKSESLNPSFTSKQHDTWAARQAATAIRSTQNSNQGTDMAGSVITNRQQSFYLTTFQLFTSDSYKSLNMLKKAAMLHGFGSKEYGKVLVGFLLNATWYALSKHAWKAALGVAAVSMFGGDDDELSELKRAEERWDRTLWSFIRGVTGQLSPVAGDRLISGIRSLTEGWARDAVTGTPLIDTTKELVTLAADLTKAWETADEDVRVSAGGATMKAATKLLWEITRLAPNPTASLSQQLRYPTRIATEGPASAIEWLRERRNDLRDKKKDLTISREEQAVLQHLDKTLSDINILERAIKRGTLDEEAGWEAMREAMRDYTENPTLEKMTEAAALRVPLRPIRVINAREEEGEFKQRVGEVTDRGGTREPTDEEPVVQGRSRRRSR